MYRHSIRRTLVTSQDRRKMKTTEIGFIKVKSSLKKQSTFSDTVLLPKTQFQVQLTGKKRIEQDAYLINNCGFSELYKWQRENLSGPDFILHDGPPYANGKAHMGHAINKVLKDITIRHKILCKNRVHYVPGWDCHGLPVELKATKNHIHEPLETRKKARIYAEEAITEQKQAFISWGITADWEKSGCYFTNQPLYIKNQLYQFLKLYENGIIFRDFMPVYWSPSTKTALAESELEYNQQHQSKAVIIRLRIDHIPRLVNLLNKYHAVYALIWTTTPWSLVANQAVAYAPDSMYCIVEDDKKHLNIIAEDLLESVAQKIGSLRLLQRFKGTDLENSIYSHPIRGEKCPFLPARHVTTDLGTGLVHIAPAHGSEDFVVAVENKMSILSLVDTNGKYTEAAGQQFYGLRVLTEGVDKVLDVVAEDVLHIENLEHSYPYDWRTKQPVVIRASKQWFFDINRVKDKVIDNIAKINIYPKCNRSSFINALLAGVRDRPYWCISRQRSWGTPIPVFYNKTTGEMLTNKLFVDRLCYSIDRYGPDCWWEHSVKKLLGEDITKNLNITLDDLEKGEDIMDIWFDSGISWSIVLPKGKADLCLEGHDQFGGWFQSSLITSIALQGCPPYGSLYVHGFAVDQNGLKMSKSIGNVVNPDELLQGGLNFDKNTVYGVDVLRWWVANHGSQHMHVPVSKDLLDGCNQCVYKLRLILRFLLGTLHPYHGGANCDPEYRAIDKYMLHLLCLYKDQMQQHYDNYEYHHAGKTIMNFIANDVSAFYCTLIKDRLYCDEVTSSMRVGAVHVIDQIFNVLVRSFAPILPHLAEEAWLYYPHKDGENAHSVPLHCTKYEISNSWKDPMIERQVNVALRLRNKVLQSIRGNTWKMYGTIAATEEDFSSLSLFYNQRDPSMSELCEILQLSSVTLVEDPALMETEIALHKSEEALCKRCRRYPEYRKEDNLCVRCINVLGKNKTATMFAK